MSSFLVTHSIAAMILGYGWTILCIVWCIGKLTAKRIAKAQPALSLIIYSGLFALVMVMVSRPVFFNGENVISHNPRNSTIGLVLFLAGIFMSFWSRLILARNWSGSVAIKEDHILIESGPYRKLRHPMYTGLTLMVLGSATVKGTTDAFVATALFIVLHIWKLRREETLLSAHFSSTYPSYKKRTNALIPFIY